MNIGNIRTVSLLLGLSFLLASWCYFVSTLPAGKASPRKVLTHQPTPDKVAPKSCIKLTKGMKTVKGTPCRPEMSDGAIAMWYDLETKLFHEWGRDGSYKVYPNPRLRRGR